VDLANTGPLESTSFILSWPAAASSLNWARRPTAEDARTLLPASVYGAALLGCGVSETGALEDCFTLRETAPGAGAAALKLAPVMAMAPVLYKGRPIRSAVQIPIHIAQPVMHQIRYHCRVAAGPKYEACQITDGGGLKPEAWPWAVALFEAFPVCPAPDAVVGREVSRGFYMGDPDISKPPAPGLAHLVTQPDWAEAPTAEMLQQFYPDSAAARASGGRAVLNCRLTAEGRTSNCTVASETPPGLGFGEAAIKISSQLKFRPLTVDCQPREGGKINLPFSFPAETG
jgi:TonB family protein